jgi:phospholipid-transporting ATPase
VALYINNKVITSKYNVLTFLPLNIMLQFSKMANFYFLVLLIMELYKPISDSGGKPILALPLGFVISISMVKDIYEDILRHRQDNDENNRKAEVAAVKIEGTKKDKKEIPYFKKSRWQSI